MNSPTPFHHGQARNQQGQAMVEYLLIVALAVVGILGFNLPMIHALNSFYNRIITIINLPLP